VVGVWLIARNLLILNGSGEPRRNRTYNPQIKSYQTRVRVRPVVGFPHNLRRFVSIPV
jgi:hypothetical protein